MIPLMLAIFYFQFPQPRFPGLFPSHLQGKSPGNEVAIPHNTLCLPSPAPQFCLNYCCETASGKSVNSQEHFTTIVNIRGKHSLLLGKRKKNIFLICTFTTGKKQFRTYFTNSEALLKEQFHISIID